MNWENGYTAEYYMSIVDPATWRDIERVEIVGGSVTRNLDGLRENATLNCQQFSQTIEQWVRIWLNAYQDGGSAHEPLFTGLATTPAKQFDGVRDDSTLTCYSVLKPVEDVLLLRGWYAAAGKNGANVIKSLLAPTPAPVVIDAESPALSEHIIAGDGETRLTMIDKILEAIDWRLRIEGNGVIHIAPKATEPAAMLAPDMNDIIENQITVNEDLFSVPNVYAAFGSDLVGIAKDESQNSQLSTVNRGREVWASSQSVSLADNESIEGYAMRKLREAQNVEKTATYIRRYLPGVLPGDMIQLKYPVQNLEGMFTVENQTVALGYAAKTNEGVRKWTASIN